LAEHLQSLNSIMKKAWVVFVVGAIFFPAASGNPFNHSIHFFCCWFFGHFLISGKRFVMLPQKNLKRI